MGNGTVLGMLPGEAKAVLSGHGYKDIPVDVGHPEWDGIVVWVDHDRRLLGVGCSLPGVNNPWP